MKSVAVVSSLVGGLLACAGCGQSPSAPANTVPVVVNGGPPNVGYVNGLFTTIRVCVPSTTDCQTIDYVLVDTGSIGLRILSSAAGGELSLPLLQQVDSDGNPVVECNAFVTSYTWGPVRLADLTMGGERVHSMAVQVVGDPAFPDVPTSCSASGGASADTLEDLGANAILGVGPYPQDCGGPCADSVTAANTDNPGNVYYACPPTGCQAIALSVAAQVENPVSLLPTDNNGVIIDLPGVPAAGAPSVAGSLVFGIGTEANNSLGNATVLPLDPSTLSLTTVYLGKAYAMSLVDSGSNAMYFLDSATTSLASCTNQETEGFYCPDTAAAVVFTAIQEGIDGATSAVSFSVADADALYANASNFAFDDVAGPSSGGEYFDWGLPFFYGRRVFSAIEGAAAPGGPTPYVAY
jgi:hypothetical protein